jgi:lipoyl(octanoyl) transferase
MQVVRLLDMGKMDYQAAWDYQTDLHRVLVDRKMQNRQNPPGSYLQDHTFMLVEHPPVYTLGKSGSMDHLLLNETQLQERGIQYFPINRGGDITYHGPGQMVGYPILDLDFFFNDVHRYVRFLEETIIRTLADFGIEGYRINDYTGVWVRGMRNVEYGIRNDAHFWDKQRKICAIGVHLSRWVTLHGFAFNVNTDLRYFDYIVPCGIVDEDKTVTSLATELGGEVDMETVKKHLAQHFSDVFECHLETAGTDSTVHS